MRPMTLGNYVPPVTGADGPSSVVANLFDDSGNFRPRIHSGAKRPRSDGDAEHNRYYDISCSAVVNHLPPRPSLDVAPIKALLVEASKYAEAIRARADDEGLDEHSRTFAKMSHSFFELLQAVVEKAIVPLSSSSAPAASFSFSVPPPTPNLIVEGEKELRDALRTADKTTVVYDANLGPVQIANRHKLNHAFQGCMKDSIIRQSNEKKTDPAEAWRIVDDALSLVKDIEFLGTTSAPAKTRSGEVDRANPRNTMPVKMTFDDKDARNYFERVMRERCSLRATPSLPFAIRKAQKALYEQIRSELPETNVYIKTCSETLSFIVTKKKVGVDRGWVDYRKVTIDPRIMVNERQRPHFGSAGGQVSAEGDMC